MRVLITGAEGFVGKHLIRELIRNDHDVIASDIVFSSPAEKKVEQLAGDLTDLAYLNRVVTSTKPDACIHMGAMSFAPAAKDQAQKMFSVNVVGTINILEAFRKNAPSATILTVSTAHVYSILGEQRTLTEQDPLCPVTFYGISKMAADLTTLAYASQYGMYTMTARPNNQIGPGQSPSFVIASLAAQIKSIARGTSKAPILVGNMDSTRNFIDVRDVVKVYRLLLEKGRPGNAYNISSGETYTIRAIFEELCKLAGIRPEIKVEQGKYRPTDSSPILDTSKVRAETGWQPEIPIVRTLQDILANS